MTLQRFLLTFIMGISNGMVNFLIAAGVSLVMGGIGLINFGQGAYYILGAYICYTFSNIYGFWWGLLAAVVITGIIGYLIEIPFRKLYGEHIVLMLMFTMGFAYIICDLMVAIWGYRLVTTPLPDYLKGGIAIFNSYFPIYYIFMIIVSSLIAFSFYFMFLNTKLGMYFRAIITDRKMVESLGINVKVLNGIMFAIAIALGGVAGALYAPVSGLSPKEGLVVFSNIMPILMIGGIRNLRGTLPAAIIVGLANAFGAIYIPSFYSMIPFMLMVIIMMYNPRGLFEKWNN